MLSPFIIFSWEGSKQLFYSLYGAIFQFYAEFKLWNSIYVVIYILNNCVNVLVDCRKHFSIYATWHLYKHSFWQTTFRTT